MLKTARHPIKLFWYLALILLISLTVIGCGTPAATPTVSSSNSATTAQVKATSSPSASTVTPRRGGTYIYGTQTPPTSLQPVDNTIINGAWLKQIFDTLLSIDEKGQIQPWLATKWTFSPDYKSLTLTLRQGVKFHDGTDFNAAAAKWNIELRKASLRGDYENVTSIDIIDNYTLRLNLSSYNYTLLNTMWYIGGLMTSPTAYQKDGADAAKFHPVGTGPFKFVSYQDKMSIDMVRNENYWQSGKPYLDAWKSLWIADETTGYANFLKGDVTSQEFIQFKNYTDLQQLGNIIFNGGPNTYYALLPDTANTDSPFAKLEVRQAMEYAMDNVGMSTALGFGWAEPMNQMAPSSTEGYVPDLVGRPYNVEKAKQLLAQAGYPNGFQSTFNVVSPVKTNMEAAANCLAAVGINLKLNQVSIAQFQNMGQQGWKGLYWQSVRIAPDWLQYFYAQYSSTTIQHKSWLRPAGFQSLLEQAMSAHDDASRKSTEQQMVRLISDQAAIIPIQTNDKGFAIQKTANVHNYEWVYPWGPNKIWSPADTWIGQ